MIRSRFLRHLRSLGAGRRPSARPDGAYRHARFESLESRQLLSITLPAIAGQTVLSGTTLNVALDGANSLDNTVDYTVSVDNANLSNSLGDTAELTATIPEGNPSLRLTIDDAANGISGYLVFELYEDLTPETVAQITSLVNSDYYDGLIFHRVIDDFMIQGGDPNGDGTGGPSDRFDDEYSEFLQFTGSGLLAMANSGCDTNGSQFFVTLAETRWLDYNHTIFGMLVEGEDVLQAISSVSTDTNDKPVNDLVITDAEIFQDTENGVLRLSASNGTTGTADVTVTATDNITGETTSTTFQVTVGEDVNSTTLVENNEPPFVQGIDPITTVAGMPVSFYIPAVDTEGDTIYYGAVANSEDSGISLTVDHSTGLVTVTPTATAAGVHHIAVGVRTADPSADWDTQYVAVYVNPIAPSSVDLVPHTDTGADDSDNLTNLNNATNQSLQFLVSGVVAGAEVELFADGTLIGSATASGTSVNIVTNGAVTLADGTHTITAKQTLANQAVNVGNLKTTTNLPSTLSASLSITIDTSAPQFTFTPNDTAVVGVPYTCQATAEDDSAGPLIYYLSQSPTGMTIDSSTGLITWTPLVGQGTSTSVVVRTQDAAGNETERHFVVDILANNAAPVLTPAAPSLGTTDEHTALALGLAGTFLNNGNGTTTITDEDGDAVVGGIALIGVTGNGTWEYSIDGTTFQAITAVDSTSALLLANSATLRYTPDGTNGETAAITYRAWDTTGGLNGGRVDLTGENATGGSTAFSVNTDTASLVVTGVNDAPVLVPANPSMGGTTPDATATISLSGTFLNNGTGTTTVSDVDQNAVVGAIALTGAAGNGTWEYSLDGTTFSPLGTVGDDSALLLPSDALLRYTPTGTDNETPAITYRAWDTTSGAAGDRIDLTGAGATGDATAFSAAADSASLVVNNAPVLTPANPVLGATDENTAITVGTIGSFINNGTGTTTVTDANSDAALGAVALIGVTGNGTWEYSLDGTTFNPLGTIGDDDALLLTADATLRYTPDGTNGETPTFTYRAWDATTGAVGDRVDATAGGGATAFSADADTASLTVTDVNDAPVLVQATPSLGSTTPDAAVTVGLGTLLNNGDGTTTVTDADQNAAVGAVALTGVTGNGTWEYSLNGTTFNPLGTIGNASALLLPGDALLRYSPDGVNSETATISYRAWDTTVGVAGDLADTTVNGNATTFSTDSDTASLTVVSNGSISGFVYIDADNDGRRITPDGQSHLALSGVVVKLFLKDSTDNWVEVAGKSPVLTAADGSYCFEGLAPGTYRVEQMQPAHYLDGLETTGTIEGVVRGTAGQDQFEIQLAASENGTEYNFGERGLQPGAISRRFSLASTPTSAQIVAQMNTAPEVDLSASVVGNDSTATFEPGGDSVAIVAADAMIADADSPMLAWMTVTISNLLDGDSETLQADTTDTAITATYADGVLTLSGAAERLVYEQVLRSLLYGNSSSSANTEDRKIAIVVDDGIISSEPATITLQYSAAESAAAADAALLDDDLL